MYTDNLIDLSKYQQMLSWLKNPVGQKPDMSGANLQRLNLDKADLRGFNLEYADLQEAILQEACLQGAFLRGAFLFQANFQNADLLGADLYRARLWCANFDGARLEGSNLILGNKNARGVRFCLTYNKEDNSDYELQAGFRSWDSFNLALRHYEEGYSGTGDREECLQILHALRQQYELRKKEAA